MDDTAPKTAEPAAPRAIIHPDASQAAAPPAAAPARAPDTMAELSMPSKDLTRPRIGTIRDAGGRLIKVKKLSAMDRLNMYEAAGPKISENRGWMGMAALACSCVSIDGDPVPKPNSILEMKALVTRLEEDGLDAIERVYSEVFGVKAEEDPSGEVAAKAKN